jgi:hypothetical protein
VELDLQYFLRFSLSVQVLDRIFLLLLVDIYGTGSSADMRFRD